ncbi:sigma-70 family RNA polymerase sigma factor [bacterium]|nr:sigma-70 family RNA polymerase sigma factor [bacterium]
MARKDASDQDIDDWIRKTLPEAVAFAAAMTGNHSLAEDIVQDCYVRLLKRRGEYDLIQDGRKLLFRSITNAAINEARSLRVLRTETPSGDIEDLRTPSPSDVLSAREVEASVASALDQLPIRERAALELTVAGESAAVIAEILEITANHVSVLVHRARARLRESLRTLTDTTP